MNCWKSIAVVILQLVGFVLFLWQMSIPVSFPSECRTACVDVGMILEFRWFNPVGCSFDCVTTTSYDHDDGTLAIYMNEIEENGTRFVEMRLTGDTAFNWTYCCPHYSCGAHSDKYVGVRYDRVDYDRFNLRID